MLWSPGVPEARLTAQILAMLSLVSKHHTAVAQSEARIHKGTTAVSLALRVSKTPVSLVFSLYRITFYYSTFGREIVFGSQFLLWGFSIMSISFWLLLWDFAEFLVNLLIGWPENNCV